MNLVISDSDISASMKISSNSINVDMSTGYSSAGDYESLSNLPKLNGNTIIGNVSEIDPTVPEWAKSENKPTYTAEEINAVNSDDAIPLEYLADLFN